MLVFALALMACGLIALVGLIVFLGENLPALALAIVVGRAALGTGGGWPGAVLAAALAFAGTTTALRLGLMFAPFPMRVLLCVIIVAPTAAITFALADGLLAGSVPSDAWRIAIALLAATAVAVGLAGHHLGYERVRDRTRV